MGKLSPFDGRDVRAATVSITNAGDGLSQAMKVDPVELHHADTVYVVLQCEVAKVRFDQIKDSDDLMRVHVLKAGLATLVEGELVADVLAAQRKKIMEATGQHELPLEGHSGEFTDDEVAEHLADDDGDEGGDVVELRGIGDR